MTLFYLTQLFDEMVLERHPPHKIINLLFTITISIQLVDDFVGELTFKSHFINTLYQMIFVAERTLPSVLKPHDCEENQTGIAARVISSEGPAIFDGPPVELSQSHTRFAVKIQMFDANPYTRSRSDSEPGAERPTR